MEPELREPERCVFCGDEPDGGVFNDGLRCKKCAEEQDGDSSVSPAEFMRSEADSIDAAEEAAADALPR